MQRVGFVCKRASSPAFALARELVPRLRAHGVTVLMPEEQAAGVAGVQAVAAPDSFAQGVDLLVILGGDGTFLFGAQLVSDRGVPILGVNLGSLGFLTGFPAGEAEQAVLAALEGRLAIEERMRLAVRVSGTSGAEARYSVVNDAVISQGALARLLQIDAELDGKPITAYRADGLIVATPTGSTAYNLAAGGPILTPDLDAIVITPICPHTLTNRPLVVAGESRINVRVPRGRNVVLTIDGQFGIPIAPGDTVEIGRAERPLRMFRVDGSAYFDVLREKLNWGARLGR